jgi:hypothetical protein
VLQQISNITMADWRCSFQFQRAATVLQQQQGTTIIILLYGWLYFKKSGAVVHLILDGDAKGFNSKPLVFQALPKSIL